MFSVRTKVAVNSLSKDSWKEKNLVIFISVLIYKYTVIMKYSKAIKFRHEKMLEPEFLNIHCTDIFRVTSF